MIILCFEDTALFLQLRSLRLMCDVIYCDTLLQLKTVGKRDRERDEFCIFKDVLLS
jgi:hypothetical protein